MRPEGVKRYELADCKRLLPPIGTSTQLQGALVETLLERWKSGSQKGGSVDDIIEEFSNSQAGQELRAELERHLDYTAEFDIQGQEEKVKIQREQLGEQYEQEKNELGNQEEAYRIDLEKKKKQLGDKEAQIQAQKTLIEERLNKFYESLGEQVDREEAQEAMMLNEINSYVLGNDSDLSRAASKALRSVATGSPLSASGIHRRDDYVETRYEWARRAARNLDYRPTTTRRAYAIFSHQAKKAPLKERLNSKISNLFGGWR